MRQCSPSPWRHLLSSCDDVLGKVIERREISRLSAIRSRGEHGLGDDIKPISFPLECPRCHTVSNMVRCRLYHLNRSRRIRCPSKQCKLTSTASKWQCPCGSSWMRCVHHRGPGLPCGSIPRVYRPIKTRVCRPRQDMSTARRPSTSRCRCRGKQSSSVHCRAVTPGRRSARLRRRRLA